MRAATYANLRQWQVYSFFFPGSFCAETLPG